MRLHYKVWVEVEALDMDGTVQHVPLPLPDCIGEFANLKDAEQRQWEVANIFCDDRENSDVNPERRAK